MISEAIVFVLSNTLMLLASAMAAWIMAGHREFWRTILITAVMFLIFVHFTVLALGLAGWLNPIKALVLTGALTAVVGILGYRRRNCSIGSTCSLKSPQPFESRTRFGAVGLFMLCGIAGSRLAEGSFTATTLLWDDMTYHATVTAQWIVDEKITLVPSTYQAYYPFSAELLSLWFMLPFGDDTFASLAGLSWLTLAACSIFGIVRGSGGSQLVAALISSLFLASPPIWNSASSFSANDVAAPALIIASVAVGIRSVASNSYDKRIDLALSALLAGIAIGCKVTFAVPAMLILLWWFVQECFTERDSGNTASTISTLLLFPSIMLLGGGYWYLRNWMVTGNPIFPAEIGPFEGPLDRAAMERTRACYWLMRESVSVNELIRLLKWPFLLCLVALTGYGWAVGRLFRWARNQCARPLSQIDLVLFGLGMLTVLVYPFVPFSGTVNRLDVGFQVSPRYIILAPICGLLLYRHLLMSKGAWNSIWFGLIVIAYGEALSAQSSYPTVVILETSVVVVCGVIGTVVCFKTVTWSRSKKVMLAFSGSAIVLIGLACWHPIKKQLTAKELFDTGGRNSPVGGVWKELENLPCKAKVGFFMSEPAHNTLYYPIFGRDLQLTPMFLVANGNELDLMHTNWREDYEDWWREWTETESGWVRETPNVSPAEFLSNLKSTGVDYVIVTSWSLGLWPPQQSLLEESGQAIEMYNDGYSAIWKSRPAESHNQ